MLKVIVNEKLNDDQKRQFESISTDYKICYDENNFDADILIGNFAPAKCKAYPNMKLMISTWAGVDAFIKKGILKDNVVLCSGANSHNEEVAEHMFSLLVAMQKNLHLYRDNQKKALWHDEGKVKSINELSVLVLGLGKIGMCLAKLLKDNGMHVIAIKRKMIDKPEFVDELYTIDSLDKILPRVDAVLNILPSTKETKHLFTLDKFKLMKNDSILINAGRGDLIDTNVLIEVLDKKMIKGIGQDVFENEPLDPNSKLWSFDNLWITPHVGGFFHLDKCRQKWVDMACENLRRYLKCEKLINLVEERE